MKETVIILYTFILQLGIAAITTGILTYLRYKKESLKYFILFMISLQSIQLGLLLKTCMDYAGKESFLLRVLMKFLDLSGSALLIFVLCIYPFYIRGRKPNKWVKICSASISFILFINYFVALINGLPVFQVINRLIISAVSFYAIIAVFSFLRHIGHAAMRNVMIYLGGISVLFIPFIFMEFARDSSFRFQSLWFLEPLSLPAYLFALSCSGLYLVRKYFSIPSFIDPEKNKLSEYFIERYNITKREEEIIMLLRKGKAYKEIAEELVIAYKTVDAHVQNIYSKTGVSSKRQLLNLIETSYI